MRLFKRRSRRADIPAGACIALDVGGPDGTTNKTGHTWLCPWNDEMPRVSGSQCAAVSSPQLDIVEYEGPDIFMDVIQLGHEGVALIQR